MPAPILIKAKLKAKRTHKYCRYTVYEQDVKGKCQIKNKYGMKEMSIHE
jgi:hypothetical protein